jgi:hypothetical protein
LYSSILRTDYGGFIGVQEAAYSKLIGLSIDIL